MKLFTTSSIQLRDFFHGGRLLISNKQGFLFYQQLRSEYLKLDNHQLFEILNEVADEENLEDCANLLQAHILQTAELEQNKC
ncbi:TPA: hypothetical protein ACF37V_003106 [Vibrio parahaemolyticus]|uniref:hypothetical protein n=1 Tax=Vibrio parahaemolyticus TaxID=670 RepID=UPI001869D119|nr:hypothetical protein [Vibrio parahaemolyticus]EGR9011763.1 hypothetical protein [Vibrio parahaemolyticus]EGV1831911.1 hypothetical protein [Vibrio parahaemolyticus]EHW0649224.1 hypothetical protein [Vibrio parahaemolyticus]MBE4005755.1 hypothetical protein [Vibrio parahaemolyticus]MCG0030600.1 hypothetical protein [Vibrio parahaemolyticus]